MNSVKPITFSLIHRHVAMLVYPDCLMIDAIGPMEVFSFTNAVLQLKGRISQSESAYTLSIIAEQRGPVKSSSGMSIVADKGYKDGSDDIDTLMVAGTTHPAYLDRAIKDIPMQT